MNVSLAKFFKNIFQEKFANSIVNLLNSPMSFRECVRITKARGIENIPTYLWFLLQFWPTHRTASKKLHRTGRFRIRRMVQAWLFRKSNADAHYANAVYKFMRERTGCQKSSKYSFFQYGCKMQGTYWGTRLSDCSSNRREKKLSLVLMRSFW